MIHHCNRAAKAPCSGRGHYILNRVSKSMDALGDILAALNAPQTNKSTSKHSHRIET